METEEPDKNDVIKMAYDPSESRKTAEQIEFQVVDLSQRDFYFQQMQQQGWYLVGNPIQFPGNSDPNTLRLWAREYAVTMNGDLIIEVNDPTFSPEPSNSLVFFIWRKRGAYDKSGAGFQQQSFQQPGVTPQQGYGAPVAAGVTQGQQGGMIGPQYPQPIPYLEQLLWRLVNILMEPNPRIHFQDTGELLYPLVKIRMNAYEHLGGRMMDLFLVKDGVHDYKILGNETHGAAGGKLTPYRDEIISMKTLGQASYLILDEFRALDQNQQNLIIHAIEMFLQQF